MRLKPNPARHSAEDAAWAISAATRQGAQEADACLAFDGWLYAAPGPEPLPAKPQATGTNQQPRTPAR